MGTIARLAPNQLQCQHIGDIDDIDDIDDKIEPPSKKRKIDKEEKNCVNPCAGIGIQFVRDSDDEWVAIRIPPELSSDGSD